MAARVLLLILSVLVGAAVAQDDGDFFQMPADTVILGPHRDSPSNDVVHGSRYDITSLACKELSSGAIACLYTVSDSELALVNGIPDQVGITISQGFPVTSTDAFNQIDEDLVQLKINIKSEGEESLGPLPDRLWPSFNIGGPAGTPSDPFQFETLPKVVSANMEFRDFNGASLTGDDPIEIPVEEYFQNSGVFWNGFISIVFMTIHGQPIEAYSIFEMELTLLYEGKYEPPLLGDMNLDGDVNLLDVNPFVELLIDGAYQFEGDMNLDGSLDLLDVDPFVAALLD